MRKYHKKHDSGPDWIIDLDGPEGNVYNLLTAIQRVKSHSEYVAEAILGLHYEPPTVCPYKGYECILDYMLYNCPEIEFRWRDSHIQQVSDYQDAMENVR